jgi:hypothetical protein
LIQKEVKIQDRGRGYVGCTYGRRRYRLHERNEWKVSQESDNEGS